MVKDMNGIDMIKQTLNNNQNLNPQTKQAIIQIVTDLIQKGYNLNLNNLNNKLVNLTVEEGKLDNQAIVYQDNKIIIDPNQARYYDHTLALTSTIIEMLRNYSDRGMITEPISLGFNESFAISLKGIDGVARYEEEQVISRMLSKMVGESEMIRLYFEGNMVSELPVSLVKLGCNPQDIKELFEMIYKNYQSKKIR